MKKQIDRLIEIMAILRSENGCPWDKKQTITSLRPYIIEEAFETVEALDSFDRNNSDSVDNLKKELGDLLLQVVFVSQMAGEEELFNFEDVAKALSDKLTIRHPHVFGDDKADTSEEVLEKWNQIKKQKENKKYLLDGIPVAMPAINLSQRYTSRASTVGFDWEKWEDVLDKVDEERTELIEAIDIGKKDEIEHELGDLLFAVINLGRKLGVDSEKALKSCAGRFKDRFDEMENIDPTFVDERKPLDELETLWQSAKKKLNNR